MFMSAGSNSADISDSSGVTQYLSSLYFVVTTLATVGYGDISPSTNAERVVAIIIMIIGTSLADSHPHIAALSSASCLCAVQICRHL